MRLRGNGGVRADAAISVATAAPNDLALGCPLERERP